MKKLLLLFLLVGTIAPHNARAMDYANIAQTGLELSVEMYLLGTVADLVREEYRVFRGQINTHENKIIRRALILAFGTYAALQLNKKAQDFSHYLQG